MGVVMGVVLYCVVLYWYYSQLLSTTLNYSQLLYSTLLYSTTISLYSTLLYYNIPITNHPQFLHEKIHDEFLERLVKAYGQVRVGNPLQPNVLCGPLHTTAAVQAYLQGIEAVKSQVSWWVGCCWW